MQVHPGGSPSGSFEALNAVLGSALARPLVAESKRDGGLTAVYVHALLVHYGRLLSTDRFPRTDV